MRAAVAQRECNCGGTCPECLGKQATEEELVSGGGQPLDKDARRPLEAHFGTDLSDVRVHTDSNAASAAASIDALAYSASRDIYFAAGMYAPASSDGQRLLAHEVAHVVQQGSGKEPTVATKSSRGVKIGAPDDSLETEAERKAERFMSGPVTDEAAALRARSPANPLRLVGIGGTDNTALDRGAVIQRQQDEPGTLTVPEITIKGSADPAAYSQGYKDAFEFGRKVNRPKYYGDPKSLASIDSYELGYSDAIGEGAKTKFEGPSISAGPDFSESEEEGPEKPDEEAEYRSADLGRYTYLKLKVVKMRQVRGFGLFNSEFELSESEREDYQRLFNKFGAEDPDPESPPTPEEMVWGEGEEGESEAE